MPDVVGIARAVHVAACLSLFGALLFRAVIAPAAFERAPQDVRHAVDRRLRALAAASLLVALVAGSFWLSMLTSAMSGARDAAETARSIGPVLLRTEFGHVFLARSALLLAAGGCLAWRASGLRATQLGAAFSGGAVVLLAAVGHAAALEHADRALAVAALSVHLTAAGAWLGGLLPLAITLALPAQAAAAAARRFSPLGLVCVVALALSAWINGRELIGSIPGLLDTPYGHWGIVKLAVFGGALGFAAANRFLFTPALTRAPQRRAASQLRISIALEAALGLAIVAAAGQMASVPPAVHAMG